MKISLLIITAFVSLFIASPVAAHVNGISVFKINGENTKVAPADYSNKKFKTLPPDLDLAPKAYRSHQFIYFELDTTQFVTPQSIFDKTEFIWDFGDGTPKQRVKNGIKNEHVYLKNGTYLLTVYADYTTAGFDTIPEPQQMEAVVIEINNPQESNTTLPASILITFVLGLMIIAFALTMTKLRKKKRR